MKLTSLDHQIFNEVIYDDRIRQAVIKKIESIDPIELLVSKIDEYDLRANDLSRYSINLTGFFIGDDSNPESKFNEVILEYIIYSIFTDRYSSEVRSQYILESAESIPIEGRKSTYNLHKRKYSSSSGGKFTVYTGRFEFKLEFDRDTLTLLIKDITNVQTIAEYILGELKSNLLKHWLKKSQGESHMFHHKTNLNYDQILLELIIGLDSAINRDLSSTPKDDISIELNHIVNEILNS